MQRWNADMILIGEKLNSAIPAVRQMIKERDARAIQGLALSQVASGVDYLDVSAAHGDEMSDMEWLVRTIQEVTDKPLCIDSTSRAVFSKAMSLIEGDRTRVMVNSISMEQNRLAEVLPIVLEHGCFVIGLTVDDSGIPKTADERIRIAERMVELLLRYGYDLNRLYIDPLVLPLAVNHTNARTFFRSICEIRHRLKVRIVSGLSNISYDMPKRRLINRYFLVMSMALGMDAAILDPLDPQMLTAIKTADLLLGNDPFGRHFIKALRSGKLSD